MKVMNVKPEIVDKKNAKILRIQEGKLSFKNVSCLVPFLPLPPGFTILTSNFFFLIKSDHATARNGCENGTPYNFKLILQLYFENMTIVETIPPKNFAVTV